MKHKAGLQLRMGKVSPAFSPSLTQHVGYAWPAGSSVLLIGPFAHLLAGKSPCPNNQGEKKSSRVNLTPTTWKI